jgi:hypothetical protein
LVNRGRNDLDGSGQCGLTAGHLAGMSNCIHGAIVWRRLILSIGIADQAAPKP